MEEDGFQLVRRSNKRKRYNAKQPDILPERQHSTKLCDEDDNVDIESLKRRISDCCNEIVGSKFCESLTKILDQAVLAVTCTDVSTPQEFPSESSAGRTPCFQGQDGNTAMPQRPEKSKQPDERRENYHDGSDLIGQESAEESLDANSTEFEIQERLPDSDSSTYSKKEAGKFCTGSKNNKDESTEDKKDQELSDSKFCSQERQHEHVDPKDAKDIETEQLNQKHLDHTEDQAEEYRHTNSQNLLKDVNISNSETINSNTGNEKGILNTRVNIENRLDFTNINANFSKESGEEKRKEEVVKALGEEEAHAGLSLVVYGLGNFTSCLIARYQLALVLALRQHLKISPCSCETYDPKYTSTEKQILGDFGFTEIKTNEEGKRRVKGATVVVMPHCGKALFNNLLWANWAPQQLQHLVVLGNSFSAMLDRVPRRMWHQHIGYIAKLENHMKEEPVDNSFTHTDIFNDLSFHWFPAHLLRQMPPSVWSQAEEPAYDASDLEIILKARS